MRKHALQSELIGVRFPEEVRVQRFVYEREGRIFRHPYRCGRDELGSRDGVRYRAEDVQDRLCRDVWWADCESFRELEGGHVGRSTYWLSAGLFIQHRKTTRLTDGEHDVIDRPPVIRRLLPSTFHIIQHQRVSLDELSPPGLNVGLHPVIVIENVRVP